MREMEMVAHLRHPHLIEWYKYSTREPWNSSLCHVCHSKPFASEKPIYYQGEDESSSIYGCEDCGFFIHQSCAPDLLPKELSHHFHSRHPLTLMKVELYDFGKFLCDLCGAKCSRYMYHCAVCKFSLDLECSTLKLTKTLEVRTPENSHPHHLFICEAPYGVRFICSFCKTDFSKTEIYGCLDCKKLLHKSCSLPLEISHEFHPEHPLALFPSSKCPVKPPNCSACSGPNTDHAFYHCNQCYFVLDLQCASLVPMSSNSESHQDLQNQAISHSHTLIQCNFAKDINKDCSGCHLHIQDSIFVCTKCGILLDKSCTELLSEIRHPFHPLHPLKLVENLKINNRLQCRGCKKTDCIFAYACSECDFYLDPQCASTKPQMIESRIHQHPLAFLKASLRNLRCNTCRAPCKKHFFQCMECDFGLHLECYPLPQVIKHDCHCDPLTLTYSQIKDSPDEDSDAEFYCNACEKRRALDDPTYFCQDCHFVAHIHCVVSEIMHYIEKEPKLPIPYGYMTASKFQMHRSRISPIQTIDAKEKFGALDENETEKIAADIDEEIEGLQTRIEALKERRKQLFSNPVPKKPTPI